MTKGVCANMVKHILHTASKVCIEASTAYLQACAAQTFHVEAFLTRTMSYSNTRGQKARLDAKKSLEALGMMMLMMMMVMMMMMMMMVMTTMMMLLLMK